MKTDKIRIVIVRVFNKTCSLGEGAVSLHFPDGSRQTLAFGDTGQANHAFDVLQKWVDAYMTEVARKVMAKLTEETDAN